MSSWCVWCSALSTHSRAVRSARQIARIASLVVSLRFDSPTHECGCIVGCNRDSVSSGEQGEVWQGKEE